MLKYPKEVKELAQKPYSLDYTIYSSTDRCEAVHKILNGLEHNPPANDLEQMASYILYGKDEDNQNAIERKEITNGSTRYDSYRRKVDKTMSLDELLESPLADESTMSPQIKRDFRVQKTRTIKRPRYNRTTGELIDVGDADIPGMTELWETIDRLEKWIAQLDGRLPLEPDTLVFEDSYRLYRLKHDLIDFKRNQYSLKDSYKPVIAFQNLDHPKFQFIDWNSDSYYWISYEDWEQRTQNALLHTISKNIEDYEIRTNREGNIEVKWVIKHHTFDWENYLHVRRFIQFYSQLRQQLEGKLDTSGYTLFIDFDYYRSQITLSPLRSYILDLRLEGLEIGEIQELVQQRFGITFNRNRLSDVIANDIAKEIATAATKRRLICDTPPQELKTCFHCQRNLPRHPLFFGRNRGRRDGLASNCKACEREMRLERGGLDGIDGRSKEKILSQMQTEQAGIPVPENAE